MPEDPRDEAREITEAILPSLVACGVPALMTNSQPSASHLGWACMEGWQATATAGRNGLLCVRWHLETHDGHTMVAGLPVLAGGCIAGEMRNSRTVCAVSTRTSCA